MRLEEIYVKEAKQHFDDFYKGDKDKHPLVVKNMFTEYSTLRAVKYNTRRLKNTISEIKPVKCSIPFYVSSPTMKKNRNKTAFVFEHKSGMFQIKLKNEMVGYIAFFDSGFGKSRMTESVLIAQEEFIKELYQLINYTQKKMSKPKPGIYKAFMGQFGVVYSKYNPKETKVIHPVADTIEKSIEVHFERLEKRKFHDRKVLLYSRVGTGKTEFLKKIAQKYKNTHSVIFTDDVGAMIEHQIKCAKSNVPTVIMLEEAEEAFMKYSPSNSVQRANSSVKNALSGFMHEKNKAGCFIIMTTNFPDRINKSISERRERVDEMFEFGSLNGKYAAECAKLYMGEDNFNKIGEKNAIEFFNDLTGVEIKYLCEDASEYCEANEREFSMEVLNSVKEKRLSQISNMNSFNSESSLYPETSRKKVGYRPATESFGLNTTDW
jgi:SpoVK/Ycf46/Vps4 family AAA+-type ATPase